MLLPFNFTFYYLNSLFKEGSIKHNSFNILLLQPYVPCTLSGLLDVLSRLHLWRPSHDLSRPSAATLTIRISSTFAISVRILQGPGAREGSTKTERFADLLHSTCLVMTIAPTDTPSTSTLRARVRSSSSSSFIPLEFLLDQWDFRGDRD